MVELEKRVAAIERRNHEVELNKAWETSPARILIITLLTYFTIVLFFYVADLPRPFVNSIVPSAGFILSISSLPFFKRLWLKYY